MFCVRNNKDMSDRVLELIIELEKIGLEQISDMMIASLRNDKKQICVDGVNFSDNVHYSKKDFFHIKRKTKKEEFYVRSNGDENTNLLLYSHIKEVIKDKKAGVFSIGSGFNEAGKTELLCICQIVDHSKLEQIQNVFQKSSLLFNKFESSHFNIKTEIIFSIL